MQIFSHAIGYYDESELLRHSWVLIHNQVHYYKISSLSSLRSENISDEKDEDWWADSFSIQWTITFIFTVDARERQTKTENNIFPWPWLQSDSIFHLPL